MAKEATLQVRMDSDLKEKVEALYREMGTSFAEAVRIFAKQSIQENGMPFRTLIDFLDEVVVENQAVICEALTLFSEL